jgi:hypothetical protein
MADYFFNLHHGRAVVGWRPSRQNQRIVGSHPLVDWLMISST